MSGQQASLGTSAAKLGAGAALAGPTMGISLLPSAIDVGGGALGMLMGGAESSAQNAAAQQQLNNSMQQREQSMSNELMMPSPQSSQLLHLGEQYKNSPIYGGMSSGGALTNY